MLDLEPGVHLEEADRAVDGDEELAGARADVARRAQDRLGRVVELLDLRVGQERRRALPRQASGAAAAASSHGSRRRPRSRARRPGTASPRAAGRSRYRSTKHSPLPNAAVASRTADSYSSAISSKVRATLSPRPPPPKAALIATGRPYSRGEGRDLVRAADRAVGARRERRADALGDLPRPDLVAERLDRLGRRADPGEAARRSRLRRRPRSRRGTRSQGGPRRRRTGPRSR